MPQRKCSKQKLNGFNEKCVLSQFSLRCSVLLIAHLTMLTVSTTNRNLIHKEIEGKLNSDNACYHSAKSILSTCLASKRSINQNTQNLLGNNGGLDFIHRLVI
jgi:hypothetical protein